MTGSEPGTERGNAADGSDWLFERDDVIEDRPEMRPSIGHELSLSGTKYTVLRRLRDEEDGKRFYHVEKQDGGDHLYAAGAIEPTFTVANGNADTGVEHDE